MLKMDLDEAIGFIQYLYKKRNDDLIFQRWIAGPQYQMSLDEFKSQLRPARARDDDEILDEVYSAFKKAGIE